MEDKILTSVKKILGLAPDYTVYDEDIIILINATFGTLNQLGVGPSNGFSIDDDTKLWSEYSQDLVGLSIVKTYVFLKVRVLFDPPTLSFLLEALNKQISESEWRLQVHFDPQPIAQ